MPEVLTAPRVMTGEQTVAGGAVVIGDRTVGWAASAAAVPAEFQALPRTDYPGATILPGLIDSHVHLGLTADLGLPRGCAARPTNSS